MHTACMGNRRNVLRGSRCEAAMGTVIESCALVRLSLVSPR